MLTGTALLLLGHGHGLLFLLLGAVLLWRHGRRDVLRPADAVVLGVGLVLALEVRVTRYGGEGAKPRREEASS
ncbi:hypothetical protein V3W47_19535 [Deinococcus sp. YIM 134068]|uniref:hypothetical protein n=1 Tax=Deinococcus lichenicola TaxID=3118910 RepID=UPI002F91D03F